MMMMDRLTERGKMNDVVLVRQGGGVGADVVPHLQCSAGLHHPIIPQLSVKGAGPAAHDSQGEFSVREREREKVSERFRERAPGLSLSVQPAAKPAHFSSSSSPFCTCLPTTLSSSFPYSHSACRLPPPLPLQSLLFQSSALIALSFSTLLFTLHPSPFPSFFFFFSWRIE